MDDVFSISNLAHGEGMITASLALNPDSSIFQGHFPGQPVVPGACMLDAVREVLTRVLEKPLRLKKAGQLKFVGMLVPVEATTVLLEITYKIAEDEIITNGKLVDGERVCLKFQGSYAATV